MRAGGLESTVSFPTERDADLTSSGAICKDIQEDCYVEGAAGYANTIEIRKNRAGNNPFCQRQMRK